jgi:hypothetical protein
MKNKVRWNFLHKKLKQSLQEILEEEHEETEYGMNVFICELDKGPLLGEEDEDPDECLIKCLKSEDKHEDVLTEASM